MANNLGDYDLSTVIYGKFISCRADTGAPATLTSGALSVYKDNSTTQSTSGVTFSGDFDSVTGLNHFTIDTSSDGTFYSAGSFFDIVVTTGTVNSVSAVGSCVGQFTIRKTSGIKPTTAGRTLDVSAGGEAGLDWANVGSPTTSLALTGTTIATTQKVDVETIKTNPVVNGGTITFPTTATLASTTNITAGTVTTATNVTTVNGLAANVITATSIAADAITDAKVASDVTIASVTGAVGSVTGAVGSVTGLTASDVGAIKTKTDSLTFTVANQVDSNVKSNAGTAITAASGIQEVKVASLAANAITATSIAADAITAAKIADGAIDAATFAAGAIDATAIAANAITSSELASSAADKIADAMLDRDMSTGTDSGSTTVRTTRQALRFLRNKWSISGTTLTVCKEDDSTSSWTSTVTGTAGADPITANDPAGP